jgi:hypothetical protein
LPHGTQEDAKWQHAELPGLDAELIVIVYPDALRGESVCDIRCTYTFSGFEQDIVLRDAPPAPEAFGPSSKTSRLEGWTKFDEPLEPDVRDTRIEAKGAHAECPAPFRCPAGVKWRAKEADLSDGQIQDEGPAVAGVTIPMGWPRMAR